MSDPGNPPKWADENSRDAEMSVKLSPAQQVIRSGCQLFDGQVLRSPFPVIPVKKIIVIKNDALCTVIINDSDTFII